MKTGLPLLVSLRETSFQLSDRPLSDIAALIRSGELVAVRVRGEMLVIYESMVAFIRRAKRQNRVRDVDLRVPEESAK
jgi:hypothetical protein